MTRHDDGKWDKKWNCYTGIEIVPKLKGEKHNKVYVYQSQTFKLSRTVKMCLRGLRGLRDLRD